jgi:hypothetical protein
VLKEATIISQSAGRVCIRHGTQLTQVEKELLTGDLAAKYPPNVAAVESEDARKIATAEAQAKLQRERADQVRNARSPAPRDPDVANSTEMARVKDAAASYARNYFTRGHDRNEQGWSFSSGCTTGEPEPMAGWVDQWRVTGEIGTRDMSAQGGISSAGRKFEAVVAKRNGGYQVIDFTKR